jgi:hypothetical protein
MYCQRFLCTLSIEICLKRQEKAKNQSDTSVTFCESLIFCAVCPQGKQAQATKKRDLDIKRLKRKHVKTMIHNRDFRMLKLKRLRLKKNIKRIQLNRRNTNAIFKK